jgi:hypothetical protein
MAACMKVYRPSGPYKYYEYDNTAQLVGVGTSSSLLKNDTGVFRKERGINLSGLIKGQPRRLQQTRLSLAIIERRMLRGIARPLKHGVGRFEHFDPTNFE